MPIDIDGKHNLRYVNWDDYNSTIKYLTVPPENQSKPAFSAPQAARWKIERLETLTRHEIFIAMQNSTEAFTFPDLPTAQKHWTMRVGVVLAMIRMTAVRPGHPIDFGYFDPSHLNETTKVPEPIPVTPSGDKWREGSVDPFFFEVKPGVPSSAAVRQIVTGHTRGECRGALHACILIGVKEALGDAAFDAMYPPGTLKLDLDLDHIAPGSDFHHPIPGDYFYMQNKDDYAEKMKAKQVETYFWSGENMIYVGGGAYSGLGKSQLSERQWRTELKQHYESETGTLMQGNPAVEIRFTDYFHVTLEK